MAKEKTIFLPIYNKRISFRVGDNRERAFEICHELLLRLCISKDSKKKSYFSMYQTFDKNITGSDSVSFYFKLDVAYALQKCREILSKFEEKEIDPYFFYHHFDGEKSLITDHLEIKNGWINLFSSSVQVNSAKDYSFMIAILTLDSEKFRAKLSYLLPIQ